MHAHPRRLGSLDPAALEPLSRKRPSDDRDRPTPDELMEHGASLRPRQRRGEQPRAAKLGQAVLDIRGGDSHARIDDEISGRRESAGVRLRRWGEAARYARQASAPAQAASHRPRHRACGAPSGSASRARRPSADDASRGRVNSCLDDRPERGLSMCHLRARTAVPGPRQRFSISSPNRGSRFPTARLNAAPYSSCASWSSWFQA